MHDLNRQQPAGNKASPLFQAVNLEFRYPDGTQALQQINLEIAPGERVALVGHNGSGKTTLARQLCGLSSPTSGILRYQGGVLAGPHLEQSRLKIGLLFQDPDDQLFGHTVIEDVAFGPRNQGLAAEHAQDRAIQMLKRVGLEHLAFKPPHNLSFGQKKRAALAGLLAMRPDVLILDEPTANLDPRQEEVFLDLMRDFPGTLICISHDLVFLYELCQRAVVLDRGRIHHDYAMSMLVSQREALREHGLDFSFRFSAGVDALPSAPPEDVADTVVAPQPLNTAIAQLVEFSDFHYAYPDGTPALRSIDLDLREGERVAIIGENGAGKSTLLSCLLGLREGRGSYRFDGLQVTRRRRRELWRKVGMVFQDCADQLFCPSVAEEVAFGLDQVGLSREGIPARVEAALGMVRLRGFEDRVPLHLSGGERKRLALACALVMQPRLLILDEPTAGLDPQGEELLLEILREIDCTLLLVSHDMYFVGELTRRTLVMHQGEIVRDLPTVEFLQDANLSNLNGLAYSYRQRHSEAIRRLQHVHEHQHKHRHLHEHSHRHDALEHSHPHEHEHEHLHKFVHAHGTEESRHEHRPRLLHDHEHSEHGREKHDHEHEPE